MYPNDIAAFRPVAERSLTTARRQKNAIQILFMDFYCPSSRIIAVVQNTFISIQPARSKTMGRILTGLGLSILVITMGVLPVSAAPLIINHQGRLLDAADKPVADGTYTITYSLFASPDGGGPLWSETREVAAETGLISCDLGQIVPLDQTVLGNDSLYLQVQVAGEAPMTPRLRVGSVPFSGQTGRIEGDITTAPGLMTVSKKGLNAVNVKRAVTSRVDDVGAVHWLDDDSDDDGVMDRSVASSCDDTGARLAIQTKGTSAKREINASTDTDAGTFTVGADLDGDGVMENTVTDSVDADGVQRKLSSNNIGSSGQDGVEVKLQCSPDSIVETSYVRKNGTFTSADFNRKNSSSNSRMSSFFDVFTEMSIEDACDATGAKHAINTKGTGGTKHTVACATDESGSSIVASGDLDGDGVPENEASLHVTPTTSGVAIKTKGTGAEANRTVSVSSGTDVSTASLACDIDDDGDGVPESEISSVCLPVSSRMAIKTKGTGAAHNRAASVTSSTDPFSGSVVCAADLDGDGVADRQVGSSVDDTTAGIAIDESGVHVAMGTKKKGGVVNGSIIVVNTTLRMVELDSDGDGYLDHSLGIGVDATHRIDVAGGAYCDGSNWVNASDVNVKENFIDVDGAELLAKIARLPITQWNYKIGVDKAKHIGPTAQDFQAIFGVGSDGKSISTIDPAGIALAAIKELRKENLGLKDKLADLQKQVDDLAAKAAETDDLRAQIKQLSAMVEIIMGAKTADETTPRLASSKQN
jgi:hypothetical protein